MRKELVRGLVLLYVPTVQEDGAAADLAGKAHLMGDDDHGHAAFRKIFHNIQHLPDHFRVKGAGRLVKEHHLGIHHQRTHNGYALLLPAGELAGICVGAVGQPYAAKKLQGLFLRLRPIHALNADGSGGQVFHHIHIVEQIELLEHHAHFLPVLVDMLALPLGADVHAVNQDLPGGRLFQQIQAAQKGAFAAAGGTDNGYHLVFIKGNADVLEDLKLMKAFTQVYDLQDIFTCHDSSSFLPVRSGGRP